MPVGQAVTASTRSLPVSSAGAAEGSSGYLLRSWASIRLRKVSASSAASSFWQKSSSISMTISRESISRCTSPPSRGAAIMKKRLEGRPSGAP